MIPSRFRTLAEAIPRIAETCSRRYFVFQDNQGQETAYSFGEIGGETARRAAGLQALGLKKGSRAALIIPEPEEFVLTFLASIRAGIVPVPIFPPPQLGLPNGYATQVARVLQSSQAEALVISAQLGGLRGSLETDAPRVRVYVTPRELRVDRDPIFPAIAPEDVAFLQYTSGSTMEPRGVKVTHRSLIVNVNAIVHSGLAVDPDRDKGITWLPLYHDMGLVGFVLAPAAYGIPVVFLPTSRFIRNPAVWLDAIHRHRGTISFAPNFAYALAARKAKPTDLERWDLSCVKALGCGAEPIRAETITEFTRVFARCGLDAGAVLPAYGLAESTLAVTMKRAGEPLRLRQVDAHRFRCDGAAEPADTAASGMVVEHVSCGRAFPGHEIAIVDASGNRLPEGREGEIWVRGPSVTAGYVGSGGDGVHFRSDGWLCTGDLGYLFDDELYVTGRLKEVIILNGRNLHPYSIEWAVSEVEGVRSGRVVAFGRSADSSEELVVVAETRTAPSVRLLTAISVAVQNAVCTSPAEVVCVRPGSLPQTSSGKLKRYEVRRRYEENRLTGHGSWADPPASTAQAFSGGAE